MNAAVVQFCDDSSIRKIVGIHLVRDAETKKAVHPISAMDFSPMSGAYEVKWERSSLGDETDGFYSASILLLAKNVDDALHKATSRKIKFSGSPLLELPERNAQQLDVDDQSRKRTRMKVKPGDSGKSSIGSTPAVSKVQMHQTKSTQRTNKGDANKAPGTAKDKGASHKRKGTERSQQDCTAKPNKHLKNPAVLQRVAGALQSAKGNPILSAEAKRASSPVPRPMSRAGDAGDTSKINVAKSADLSAHSTKLKAAVSSPLKWTVHPFPLQSTPLQSQGDSLDENNCVEVENEERESDSNSTATVGCPSSLPVKSLSGTEDLTAPSLASKRKLSEHENQDDGSPKKNESPFKKNRTNSESDSLTDSSETWVGRMPQLLEGNKLPVLKPLPLRKPRNRGKPESDDVHPNEGLDFSASESDEDATSKLLQQLDDLKRKYKQTSKELRQKEDEVENLNSAKIDLKKQNKKYELENQHLKKILSTVSAAVADFQDSDSIAVNLLENPLVDSDCQAVSDESRPLVISKGIDYVTKQLFAHHSHKQVSPERQPNSFSKSPSSVGSSKNTKPKKKVPLVERQGIEAVNAELEKHKNAFLAKGQVLPTNDKGLFELNGVQVDGQQYLMTVRSNYASNLNAVTRESTSLTWTQAERRKRSLEGKVSNRFKNVEAKQAATPSKVDLILGTVKFCLQDLQGIKCNASMEALLKNQKVVLGNKLNQEDQKMKRNSKKEEVEGAAEES